MRMGNFIIDDDFNVFVTTAVIAETVGVTTGKMWRILKSWGYEPTLKTGDGSNFYPLGVLQELGKEYKKADSSYKTLRDIANMVHVPYMKVYKVAKRNHIHASMFVDGMYYYNPENQYKLLDAIQKCWEKKSPSVQGVSDGHLQTDKV